MPERRVTLPQRLEGRPGLVLRRWQVAEVAKLQHVVNQSAEHLRAWMDWANEPLSLADREAVLRGWEHEWAGGGDVVLGVFLDGRAVGGCGLHRSIAPDGLEIGYWIHPSFTRRGLATSAAALLSDAAFGVHGITHVEIHHDKANVASAAIPRRLGYVLASELPDLITAPRRSASSSSGAPI